MDRETRAEEATHSIEMAGLSVSDAFLDELRLFVSGDIDADELVELVKERYGIE